MSFFKEFKDDLSQAVNELLPDDKLELEEAQEQMVNTLDSEEDGLDAQENEKINEWLDEKSQEEQTETSDISEDEQEEGIDLGFEDNMEKEGESMDENVDLELLDALNADEEEQIEVENKENEAPKLRAASISSDDEVTVISKGTTITGSISTDGSLDIMGTINGDVECLGKLSITGKVAGNSSASEVYVNTDRLEGSITSEGSVKIGLGTVCIGDITATSGVIAGAVKGEIDVNGPIVIDSTAIIKGNIKAKSVQINNGAVIEGFCSLSYSSVNVDNIFE
ncbi:MAG TPA: polymer-forming cytoskeletal protein [Mobilitalea sp.]|nr:polymer-forming cytoskeletal protein [Mobilitalea sp.]